jgi:uncharacterized damage-inducible protein DinB
MTFSEIGVTHLDYHRWATNQVMDECQALPAEMLVKDMKGSFPSIYDYLAHMYQADSVWLDRLEERPVKTREEYAAPGCTYDLRDAWLSVIDKMASIASALDENGWARVASYKTMAGTPLTTPVWQMILHIVNHGTHHRGQITNMFRQLGVKPVSLDLIGFYRDRR